MAWDKGWNFRATSGYVTDGTNETYCLQEVYPVTRNGVTFGWDTATASDDARDRNNTTDRRLAGINATGGSDTPPHTFRVDLPASGDYIISLATGDFNFDQSQTRVFFYDNTTLLFTISTDVNCAAANFIDANGTKWSAAAWPGSNTTKTLTFATTTFKMVTGVSTPSHIQTSAAHLFLSQIGGGGGGGFLIRGGMSGGLQNLSGGFR